MNKSLNRLDSVLLVAGPVAMLAGGLMLVRYDDQGWNEVLDAMAAHPDRSNAGWLLALAGAALVIPPTVALAALVRARRPVLGAVASVLTILGWCSVPALAMGAIVMEAMSHSPDRAGMVAALRVYNNGASSFVFLAAAAGAIGYIVFAVGLARSRTAPVLACVLCGLGGAGTMVVMGGPVRSLLLLALALLLAGHAWIVAAAGSATGSATGTPAAEDAAGVAA